VQSPPLKITFLGTGTSSGVPMVACPCSVCASADTKDKRLRSSILVQSAATAFVVDTTPDFRYQMLREKVTQLDAVLFTHPHKDHVAGLDDIRAFNFFQQKAMNVYANSLTEETIKREFAYAFSDKKYPGVPEIPIEVWHHKMPVLGFRFGKFTYITDANRIEDAEKEKIRGSETIVLNALRREKHISHYTLDEAIDEVRDLNIPAAYFTHISHQLGLHQDINNELPEGIELAFDGLTISVDNTVL
jgi:phosphoribosyl 1,2-cyclic phosphate phosphodiesterase